MMGLEELARWGWLISLLLTSLLAWLGWSARRMFVSHEHHAATVRDLRSEIAAVEHRWRVDLADALRGIHTGLRDMTDRQTRVEERLQAAPSHADLTRLHERLDAIAAEVGRVGESLAGVAATAKALERSLHLLNEHHLSRRTSAGS